MFICDCREKFMMDNSTVDPVYCFVFSNLIDINL